MEELRENWETFGTTDPLWAVHTGHGRIGWDEDAFFETGRAKIDATLAIVERAGLTPNPARALDFGCGVGRLSLSLATHFERVDGIDISEPMLERAETFKSVRLETGSSVVKFHHNAKPDLALFPDQSFNFVLTLVTLQHMKPELAREYIAEFCRVADVGGILVFQIPARRRTVTLRTRGAIGRLARRARPGHNAVMEMYGTPRREVEEMITSNGLRVVEVVPDQEAGPTWESYTYVATRP